MSTVSYSFRLGNNHYEICGINLGAPFFGPINIHMLWKTFAIVVKRCICIRGISRQDDHSYCAKTPLLMGDDIMCLYGLYTLQNEYGISNTRNSPAPTLMHRFSVGSVLTRPWSVGVNLLLLHLYVWICKGIWWCPSLSLTYFFYILNAQTSSE